MIVAKDDLTAKKHAGFGMLSTAEYGTLFPHAALAEVFEEDSSSLRYGYLVREVMKRLEREANRTLQTVRGVGYRVALPSEHLDLAHKRHMRASRQKRRGISILEATDTALLTPEERRRLDDRLILEKHHASVLRHIKCKVEKANRTTEEFISTKLDAALARIEKLEGKRA